MVIKIIIVIIFIKFIAPIVQRIEQARPKGKMVVQFRLGAQMKHCICLINNIFSYSYIGHS